MKRLESPVVNIKPKGVSNNREQWYRFQADGKPICLRCSQPGHIARLCRVELSVSPTVRGASSLTMT